MRFVVDHQTWYFSSGTTKLRKVAFHPSELILNPDGSIYHLNLLPEDIADTIFFVGDPSRVKQVSRHFDRILVRKQKREFITHTGELNGRRLTVISTGIGTDNIDIVINELDALANIDLEYRVEKPEKKQLTFVRIGTSGGIHPDVEVDRFVKSTYGIGMDGLGVFYKSRDHEDVRALENTFHEQITGPSGLPKIYAARGTTSLLDSAFPEFIEGMTLTATGFYGPQGRSIRLPNKMEETLKRIQGFSFQGLHCTNIEMETAAIYLLSDLLGHRALSCNVILANRIFGTFSTHPKESINRLIEKVLDHFASAAL